MLMGLYASWVYLDLSSAYRLRVWYQHLGVKKQVNKPIGAMCGFYEAVNKPSFFLAHICPLIRYYARYAWFLMDANVGSQTLS